MRSPHVWLINAIDGLPGEGFKLNRYPSLATAFAEAGWATTWITSSFSHYGSQQREFDPAHGPLPYELVILPVAGYPAGINIRRIRNNRQFGQRLREWGQAPGRARPDLIVASHPTPEGLSAGRALAHEYGAAFIADIRDTWPDTFEATIPDRLGQWGRRGKPLLGPAIRIASIPWRRQIRGDIAAADLLLAVSESYARWGEALAGRDPAGSLVAPLGAAIPQAHRPARGAAAEVTVAYVGALGHSFDWQTLAAAIPLAVAADDRLRFWLIGAGSLTGTIEQRVAHDPALAGRVRLFGLQPHEEVTRILARADIGLHVFIPTATQSITNKLIDYLMAGLPVVNSQPGEVEAFLQQEAIGATYRSGDPAAMAAAIVGLATDATDLDAASTRARDIAEHRFGVERIYRDAVGTIIERLAPQWGS